MDLSLGRCSSAEEEEMLADLAIVVLSAADVVSSAILYPKLHRPLETYLDKDTQALKWHPLLPKVIEFCLKKYRDDGQAAAMS